MNDTLASNPHHPFFMTFFAGESVAADIHRRLLSCLDDLPDHSAGVRIAHPSSVYRPASPPRGPVVWRTDHVLSGPDPGFAEWEDLPFERYLLLEKQHRLSNQGLTWSTLTSAAFMGTEAVSHGSIKEAEEWNAIRPILQASPAQNGGMLPEGANPLITVLLCTYNDSMYLPWAIRSVLSQTFTNWELIIVDDGSTDSTGEVLRRILKKHPDSRIRTVRHDRNLGKSHALNRGLALAKGTWILELDSDDWFAPRCLQSLAEEAKNLSRANLIYGDRIEWAERFHKQLAYQGIKRSLHPITAQTILANACPIAPRMYRASLIRSLSGWNISAPWKGRLYEDLELLIRVIEHSGIRYISEPLYHRRIRRESVTHLHHDSYSYWRRWRESQVRDSHPVAENPTAEREQE